MLQFGSVVPVAWESKIFLNQITAIESTRTREMYAVSGLVAFQQLLHYRLDKLVAVFYSSYLQHAKLPIAAAHAPGCMFVCDKPMKKKPSAELNVIKINTDKNDYSLCSKQSAEKIDLIEAASARDPGHRGIQHMIQPQTLR